MINKLYTPNKVSYNYIPEIKSTNFQRMQRQFSFMEKSKFWCPSWKSAHVFIYTRIST